MSEAIVAMQPGERPKDDGWYVMISGTLPVIVEVDSQGERYYYSGIDGSFRVEDETFIARIYPERIEALGDERKCRQHLQVGCCSR